jgi:hypothetical protein
MAMLTFLVERARPRADDAHRAAHRAELDALRAAACIVSALSRLCTHTTHAREK